MFNTLEAYKRLVRAGIPEAQAEVQVQICADLIIESSSPRRFKEIDRHSGITQLTNVGMPYDQAAAYIDMLIEALKLTVKSKPQET